MLDSYGQNIIGHNGSLPSASLSFIAPVPTSLTSLMGLLYKIVIDWLFSLEVYHTLKEYCEQL